MSVHSISEHPRFRATENTIRRSQLESAIGYRRSTIQAFIAEGMPTAGQDRKGRNLFYLSEVSAWLDRRNMGNGLATLDRREI